MKTPHIVMRRSSMSCSLAALEKSSEFIHGAIAWNTAFLVGDSTIVEDIAVGGCVWVVSPLKNSTWY